MPRAETSAAGACFSFAGAGVDAVVRHHHAGVCECSGNEADMDILEVEVDDGWCTIRPTAPGRFAVSVGSNYGEDAAVMTAEQIEKCIAALRSLVPSRDHEAA